VFPVKGQKNITFYLAGQDVDAKLHQGGNLVTVGSASDVAFAMDLNEKVGVSHSCSSLEDTASEVFQGGVALNIPAVEEEEDDVIQMRFDYLNST
jgi:hypothetical protein